MVFGRKKTAKVIEPEEIEEEKEKPEDVKLVSQQNEDMKLVSQPFKKQQVGKGKIISGESLEGNLFRFIVISNKSIGEIGEEFEI